MQQNPNEVPRENSKMDYQLLFYNKEEEKWLEDFILGSVHAKRKSEQASKYFKFPTDYYKKIMIGN